MRPVNVRRWLSAMALLSGLCSCESAITFEPYTVRRPLNLARVLGPQLTLIGANDTLNLAVGYEPATRLSTVTTAPGGDTVLHGWLSRYRGLYYVTEPYTDSAYNVRALRIGRGQVQGLTAPWRQAELLWRAVDAGQYEELISFRDAKREVVRMRYDARALRPFFEMALDSCEAYRIAAGPVPAKPTAAPVVAARIQSVYPNPAHDRATVQWQAAAGQATLELLDGRGQRVYQAALQGGGSVTVPLTGRAPGTYVVRVRSGSASASHRLVVE